MELRLVGNDIEFDRQKIARLFDLSPALRMSREEAFKKSNEHDESVDAAYQEGRAEGEWWRVE